MHAFEDQLHENNTCIIIPTYNNAGTLKAVLSEFNGLGNSVFVVNDGSTDDTENILLDFKEFYILSYSDNKGKGNALNLGFKDALSKGFQYAITFDSDGQHLSQDIPKFIEKIKLFPGALLVGSRNLQAENMPEINTFGNKFSNFWFQIETGVKLPDTQSGFRLYPLKSIQKLHLFTSKYEFELEVLVRAVWNRIPVHPVPISVYYPPEGERVSHFKPLRDFTRISIMNTVLVLMGLLVYRPINFIRSLTRQNIKNFIKTKIIHSNESIEKKAMAIGFGVFMGIFPVWGYQMLIAVLLAHFFKLNKAIVLLASNISIGPLIPVTIYLSFLFGGLFISEPVHLVFDWDEIDLSVIWDQLYQYLIGSITLAISAGTVFGTVSYFIFWTYQKLRLKMR